MEVHEKRNPYQSDCLGAKEILETKGLPGRGALIRLLKNWHNFAEDFIRNCNILLSHMFPCHIKISYFSMTLVAPIIRAVM